MNNDVRTMIKLNLPFFEGLYYDGPQEEADRYLQRMNIRQEVYGKLLEEFDVSESARGDLVNGTTSKEDEAKLNAIENDPRWKFPLGDGVEPRGPRLHRVPKSNGQYDDFWIIDPH